MTDEQIQPDNTENAELLYRNIRSILESARSTIARSVNTTQVMANWLIGQVIVEKEQDGQLHAIYGKGILRDISIKLKAEYGNGYSVDNLELYRRFYKSYPLLISDAVRRKSTSDIISSQKNDELSDTSVNVDWRPGILNQNLSWTHYRTLLKVDRSEMRDFYEIEAIKNNWSARHLERQINSLLFQRLLKSKNKEGMLALANEGQVATKPIDIIKDPYVLEFLDLPESPLLVESELETALLTKLQDFLLELGHGFAFVGRQKRMTLDGDHFYPDLVFYHIKLRCYVIIDLKVNKLTHGDLGQMLMYVHYYDRGVKSSEENPTIGLILCTDKNEAVVQYVLDEKSQQIFTSRYCMHLPTTEELQAELRRELEILHHI
ncbi:MAG: PDDEXK nuclease domain-containing protein [bacterium]